MENIGEYAQIAEHVLLASAAVATVIKPDWKGIPVIGQLLKLISFLGMNFGHAKNAK